MITKNFLDTSFYGEHFSGELIDYNGPDYSQIAFIFPGQGAAKSGMLKSEIKRWPTVLEFLQEADNLALKHQLSPISEFIFSPENIKSDSLLTIQNLAHFSVQIGLFKSLTNYNKRPFILTAHSFGEYPMLVAADIISFEDMFEIILKREEFSPLPNEAGSMLVIQLNDKKWNEFQQSSLSHFTDKQVYIANINSESQITVSIAQNCLSEVQKLLKKDRIAFKTLSSVERPYHGPLMENTRRKLKEWLSQKNYKISPCRFNIHSSVNNTSYNSGYLFSKNEVDTILSEQLIRPCFFNKQIQSIHRSGTVSYLELGESNIYLNFIADTLPTNSFHGLNILDCLPYEKPVENKTYKIDSENSLIFKTLSKYINKVTGFNFLEVSVFDKFQEDLRIDSIKKAEIIFKTLKESNVLVDESITLAQLQSIGDTVEYLEKIQNNPQINFLKADVPAQIKDYIAQMVEVPYYRIPGTEEDDHFVSLELKNYSIEHFEALEYYLNQETQNKNIIIILTHSFTLEQNFEKYLSFLSQINKLTKYLRKTTAKINFYFYSTHKNSTFELLTPFFKSYSKENSLYFKSILNLEKNKTLKDVFEIERKDTQLVDLIYENNKRYSYKWVPVTAKTNINAESKKILIVGGASGLGLETLKFFSQQQGIMVFAIGRRPLDKTPLYKIKERLKYKYYKCDALDICELQKTLEKIIQEFGHLDLIINSAGVEISKKLQEFTANEVQSVFETKIEITNNLISLTKQLQIKLINFSSIIGYFGNSGQTIYSLANNYQLQQSSAVNIAWPGIENLGMTENLGILHKLKNIGVALLPKEDIKYWIQYIINNQFNTSAHYLFDIKDALIMEMDLRDYVDTRLVLGELISPAKLLFRKSFNLQNDKYLQDHIIENSILLPASYAMASSLFTSKYLFKDFGVIQSFSIKNMMVIPDDQDVITFFKFSIDSEANHLRCLISSQIEHFETILVPRENPSIHVEKKKRKYDQKLVMNTFYFEKCINFGEHFKVLTSAYYDTKTNNVVGIREGATPSLTGNIVVDSLMTLIELAFQSASLLGLLLRKGLAIPQSIGKLTVNQLQYNKCFAYPEIIQLNLDIDELPMIVNITLFNEDNECLMLLENVEMVPIRKDEFLPFDLQVTQIEI